MEVSILNGYKIKDKKATRFYDTVQDMKEDETLKEGMHVKTKGYYSVNDGGGAEYFIRESLNSETENGLINILSNGLIAEMIILNNTLYSKQIGLKGDNTTDETNALNNFYNLDINANKILNKGIYKISSTVFIKGQWNQSDNSHFKIIFDKSSIHYTGTENNCSLFFYNLYLNEIDGVSITRDSNENYIDFIGCSVSNFKNFDVNNVGIRQDKSIIDNSLLRSEAVELMTFEEGYIRGTVTINPTGSYTNQINFNKVNINPVSKDYCINLLGTNSKHNICFNQCDLSRASTSVFNVNELNTGKGVIQAFECYFDSSIPMFSNNTQNGLIFNNLMNKYSAQSVNQVNTTTLKEILSNLNLGNDVYSGNHLPIILRNYAKNGDINSTTQDESTNRLLGVSKTNYDTKEMITSNSGLYGHAQKITFSQSEMLYCDAIIDSPFNSFYTFSVRMKVISGSCTKIQLGFGGEYMDYAFNKLPVGEEIVITNNKNVYRTIGQTLRASLEVVGNDDLVIEVYEVMIIPGKISACGLPLIQIS